MEHESLPGLGVAEARPPARNRLGAPFVELVLVLALAFGLAYAVQAWLIKPYRIPSGSMLPTLHVGDRVLALRFPYDLHAPRRGDVVVFHPPGHGQQVVPGAHGEASVNFIKRVIGLPGEVVLIRDGTVSICRRLHGGCRALHESYLASSGRHIPDYGPYRVPRGDYFVLGDNRADSDDSRVWGPLPRANIIGRAFSIYWPLPRVGGI